MRDRSPLAPALRLAPALLLPAALAACAGGPSVRTSDALPLREVVLHRNGVGYFARSGRFDGDELVFEVRRRDVGDFLASLAAVERDGGTVTSVSFEVDPPAPRAEGEPPRDPGEDLVDVRLRFSDDEHDLLVSYVVAAPIWKPTYRLVLGDDGRAVLQGWGVVQNVTGEDWDDVALSLTTGTPIAFETDLATPVTPRRPRVTDRGDVVMAVPEGDVAYARAPAPSRDAATEVEEEMAADEAPGLGALSASGGAARSSRRREAPPAPAPRARIDAGQVASSVSVAASATAEDGVTRYDLVDAVTVPDGGSTMVAIVSADVPGEAAHLWAPEPGVPDSRQHPFRVARLRNDAGASLERGPITVYGASGFLGQGVLSPMPADASGFVPFALDRSLTVQSSPSREYVGATLVRIVDGRVTIERVDAWRTTYEARNGGPEATRLFFRHPTRAGAELHEPPEGTELADDHALVPLDVPARGEARLVVDQRTRAQRVVDVFSTEFRDAVALYLSGEPDEEVAPALRQALELQQELMEARRRTAELERERNEVRRSAAETRSSLEALREVERASDLRARLVRRLEEADRRDDALTREIVGLQTRERELRVRLREAVAGVSLTP